MCFLLVDCTNVFLNFNLREIFLIFFFFCYLLGIILTKYNNTPKNKSFLHNSYVCFQSVNNPSFVKIHLMYPYLQVTNVVEKYIKF